eukprot:1159261-Pelagomonas_calceolata.AAC.3
MFPHAGRGQSRPASLLHHICSLWQIYPAVSRAGSSTCEVRTPLVVLPQIWEVKNSQRAVLVNN